MPYKDFYGREQVTVAEWKAGRATQATHTDSEEKQLLTNIRAEAQRQFESDPERIRQREEDERQSEATYKDYYLTQMFAIPIPGHGFPIRNRASEQMILGWLNPGETLSREFLLRIIQENPSLASRLQWRSVNPKKAEARQQELDKHTFAEAAKELRSFGVTEANFGLIRSSLGSGFSVYAIQQALASNTFQLSGPSQEELTKWATEDIETHNQRLLHADDVTLRAAVKQESAARQQAVQQEQHERQLDAQRQRESAMGFAPLPSDITRDRIRAAAPSELKLWMKRYGQFQLNSRLAGKE